MNANIDKQKMKIIIASGTALVLLISAIILIACLNMGKNTTDADKQGDAEAFAQKEYSSAEESNKASRANTSPAYTLLFKSNGDGSCSVVGIGSFAGTELIIPAESSSGETVTAISEKAFKGAQGLQLITIPATVTSIGAEVFVDCPSLCDITVNSANTKYCSVGGVLFTKDKTELICYPANKVGKNYLLSTNVKKISDFAFDGIKNLKNIYYEGSASKYQSIELGKGNQAFSALSVTCNYVPAK